MVVNLGSSKCFSYFSMKTYVVGTHSKHIVCTHNIYFHGQMKKNINITKTCLYNVDPLKPHFYIVKLGFSEVYIIFFLFSLENIDCGYPLEPPRRGGSNMYPQSMF